MDFKLPFVRGAVSLVSACCMVSLSMAAARDTADAAGASPAVEASAGASAPLTADSPAQAAALADSAGQPVEILPDRTDYSQTFAEPGGGMELDESTMPQRVRQPDGSWVPVDTSLSEQGDGTWAPGAITAGALSISGGGTGPLYTLSRGGQSLSVWWPYGPLPSPAVSGATATFTGVLPGVDLLVSATPTGVSDLVEVTSAAAAANPDLARLSFPVAVSGLSLSASASGSVSAADSSGSAVFTAPPAQMWDSAGSADPGNAPGGSAGALPPGGAAAGGPLPGDHVALVGVSAGGGMLSLTPAPSVLSGGSVVYPVYIDPTIGGQGLASWLDVWKDSNGSTGGDWEPSATCATGGCGIREGVWCYDDGNGNCTSSYREKVRSYLNFGGLSQVDGAAYVDAQLASDETWSWTCSEGTEVLVYRSGHADKGITWGSRPAEYGMQDSSTKAYGNRCPAHGVTFNVTSAVKWAAGNGENQVTLELRAALSAESGWNVYSWRRFTATDTTLKVFWLHKPDTPSSPLTHSVFDPVTGKTVSSCAGSQSSPDWTSTTSPEWSAKIGDPDGGNIDAQFPWTNLTSGSTGTKAASQDPAGLPPGSTFTVSRGASSNAEYVWKAYGTTLQGTTDTVSGQTVAPIDGPWSGPCYFATDTSAPDPPTVTSDVYQNGTVSGQVGEKGTFTFSDPGNSDPFNPGGSGAVNDVVGYEYGIGISGQTPGYVQAGSGNTATVTFAPFSTAAEDLWVRAVDRAGNVSAADEFVIEAAAPSGNRATLAWWKMNSGSTGALVDATGDGNDAALHGVTVGCDQGASPPGYSCTLGNFAGGNDAETSAAAGTVVGNNGPFTASVWVYLASNDSSTHVALSQSAVNTSGFSLGYRGSCGCWYFDMPASDSSSATDYAAESPAGLVQPGVWTQLTGVFDPDAINPDPSCTSGVNCKGAVYLYVDGSLAATTWGATKWPSPAGGVFRIGAGGTGTGPSGFWSGRLSDACVFYGPMGTSDTVGTHVYDDIADLYAGGTGDGCAALYARYP